MRSLFFRTLLASTAALFILIAIMLAIFILGYDRSLKEWSETKQSGAEKAALRTLEGHPEGEGKDAFPQDTPLFVYNVSRELVYSNRGSGRRINPNELTPVKKNGELLGYYYSGSVRFKDDTANQRFIDSMSRTIWIALVLSSVISLLLTLLFSRSLSAPALMVASGLDQISRGNLDISIPEKGAGEITRIARSANQLRVQLKRERELRQQWAQDIAHDLRTPISVLKAQFEGMRDGVLDLSLERVERNLNEIARMEHLVSDLEELMVLEAPEKKINRVRINARTFLDSLRHTYSYELEKRKIRLECRTDVPAVFADQGMIDRAVSNFIANALRHTPENGTIGIFIERRNGEVAIRVSDTGEGIPPDEIGRVFDRLFRGDHARNSPGSGLGLTIARKIAELHGGSVTIQSRLGAGTTVELLLPFSEEENRENGGTSSGEP